MKEIEAAATFCTQELLAIMTKYFPKDNRSYAQNPIASLIAAYEYSQQSFTDFLSKVIQNFFVHAMPKMMEDAEYVHNYLKTHGHTKRNRGGHGNGDSYVWYIPCKKEGTKLMGYCDQNLDYIIVLENDAFKKAVHVRGTRMKGSSELSYLPISAKYRDIIRSAHNIQRDKEPRRDPLWFKDCRDIGYILSYEHSLLGGSPLFEKVDGAAMRISEIGHVLFCVNSQRTWVDCMEKDRD